jgi:ribosome-associated protein
MKPILPPKKSATSIEDILSNIHKILDGFKLDDVTKFNLTENSSVFEYAFIASGRSSTQIKSIAKELTDKLKLECQVSTVIEGYARGEWVLIATGTIQINLFLTEIRLRYNLEDLWKGLGKQDA